MHIGFARLFYIELCRVSCVFFPLLVTHLVVVCNHHTCSLFVNCASLYKSQRLRLFTAILLLTLNCLFCFCDLC